MRRRAIIVVIPEETMVMLLGGAGCIQPLCPPDSKVTGYHHNMETGSIELRVEHPKFQEVPATGRVPVFQLDRAMVKEPSSLVRV